MSATSGTQRTPPLRCWRQIACSRTSTDDAQRPKNKPLSLIADWLAADRRHELKEPQGRAMALTVCRRTLTAEALIRPQANACPICLGQNGVSPGFFRVPRFSRASITVQRTVLVRSYITDVNLSNRKCRQIHLKTDRNPWISHTAVSYSCYRLTILTNYNNFCKERNATNTFWLADASL